MVVVVIMIVRMRTVVIMMVMSVPVIMPMTIAFVLGIVSFLTASSRHKHLEVFWAVRVVMVFAKGPVIQQRISGQQSRLGAIGILHRC
jgi:hypothetical protein